MSMYATPAFITESLIVTYVQLFQTTVTVNIKGLYSASLHYVGVYDVVQFKCNTY